MYTLRTGRTQDHTALGRIMYESVHTQDSPYTPAQRQAWMPKPRSGPEWSERLLRQMIWVAEKAGQPVGFMSLRSDGYVDFAYILEAARGQGLFRRLHARLEETARGDLNLTQLETHASLLAAPAFTAMGYAVRAPEIVEIDGERLKRFDMAKPLYS